MMALTAVFLLLSSLAVGAVLGDVDPGVQQRCEYVVRELPKNLQVSMQVQYTVYNLHEGKTKIKQRLLANIREALSHGPPQMGYIEVIKPEMRRAGSSSSAMPYLRNKYIWNPHLVTTFHQFLVETEYEWPNGGYSCKVDSMEEEPILDALFGIYDVQNFSAIPSITGMLHFDGNDFVCMGVEVAMGVNSLWFQSKKPSAQNGARNLTVDYFWSDPMKWVSPEDRPFPVVASVSYFNAEGDLVEITMDFHDFQDGATSQENFQPPRDITCMNRKDAAPLGIRLPNQFAYETELVVNDEPASSSPSTTSIRTILGYTRTWFDFNLSASKVHQNPGTLTGTFMGDVFVTEVTDYNARLVYESDSSTGYCKINPAWGLGGMPTPASIFGLDQAYVYNGKFKERSRDVGFYQTLNGEQEISERTESTILGLNLFETVVTDDDGNLEYRVPVIRKSYQLGQYTSYSRTENFFGFDTSRFDESVFDVIHCFNPDEVESRVVRIQLEDGVQLDSDMDQVRADARKAVAEAAKVNPFRVQGIQTAHNLEENCLYILFTILDFPAKHLNVTPEEFQGLPAESTLSLSAAIGNLQSALQNDLLVLPVVVNTDQGVSEIMAHPDKDYFPLSDTSSGPSYSIKDHSKDGYYSPGAMAGMAFGMIILGTLLAGVSYYFFLRGGRQGRGPKLIASPRGVENPVVFSSLGES